MFNKIYNYLIRISLILILFFLSSCGILEKPDWSKPAEPSGLKRSQQNVKEGRGIKFGNSNKNSGNFLFASSNPLWKASLDTIDFMGLANVDYAGGLIITDWYSDNNPKESIRFTLRFLSNDIRVDAIKVDIRKKTCDEKNNCIVKKIEDNLESLIKEKILKKAALYKKNINKEQIKNRPKKVWGGEQ